MTAFLALLALGGAPAGALALEDVDVVSGFYPSTTRMNATRRLYRDVRYTLHAGTVPLDRLRIRSTSIIYIDQFPAGFELFRDDLEAFHKMLADGGALVLVGGPDTPQSTIDNFNYLGRRFGFEFAGRAPPGEIIPEIPGHGPMDGNVWFCERGTRLLELASEDWRVHYRVADSTHAVVASQRVGKGLLVLVGTREIERSDAVPPQNALTLIDWGHRYRGLTEAELPEAPRPAVAGAPADPVAQDQLIARRSLGEVTLTNAQLMAVLEQPSSDQLPDRIRMLRQAFGAKADAALTGSSLLVERGERTFFPRLANAVDLRGNAVNIDRYRGGILLVFYGASWSAESRQLAAELKPVLDRLALHGRTVQVLGVSLDRSREAAEQFARESGLNWRVVFDGQGYSSPLLERPEIRRIPRVFVVDRDGRLCAGDLPPVLLEQALIEAYDEAR